MSKKTPQNLNRRDVVFLISFAAGLYALVKYLPEINTAASKIFEIIKPITAGVVWAFIINLFMKKIESVLLPRSKSSIVARLRRPAALIITLLFIALLVLFFYHTLLPQLSRSVSMIYVDAPVLLKKLTGTIEKYAAHIPPEIMPEGSFNLEGSKIFKVLLDSFPKVSDYIINLIKGLAGEIWDAALALVFAVFLIFYQDTLFKNIKNLSMQFLSKKVYHRLKAVFKVVNESCTAFVIGQLAHLVIASTLCYSGMLIFDFPQPLTVTSVVAICNLIPIIGAWISTIICGLLILLYDSSRLLPFIIFLIMVEQIESNIIYPPLVGSSLGLPGIWMFTAITVGGAFSGVKGIFLAVPLMSIIYKLLWLYVRRKKGFEFVPEVLLDDETVAGPIPLRSKERAETRAAAARKKKKDKFFESWRGRS